MSICKYIILEMHVHIDSRTFGDALLSDYLLTRGYCRLNGDKLHVPWFLLTPWLKILRLCWQRWMRLPSIPVRIITKAFSWLSGIQGVPHYNVLEHQIAAGCVPMMTIPCPIYCYPLAMFLYIVPHTLSLTLYCILFHYLYWSQSPRYNCMYHDITPCVMF